jgi:large subunit ribosomal protein L22
VIDQIRGVEVFHALNVLKLTSKANAPAIAKLLKAAIASYEEKYDQKVNVGTHFVKTVFADGGMQLKRMLPAPQGRAYVIRKRFCHITLVIDLIPEQAANS